MDLDNSTTDEVILKHLRPYLPKICYKLGKHSDCRCMPEIINKQDITLSTGKIVISQKVQAELQYRNESKEGNKMQTWKQSECIK